MDSLSKAEALIKKLQLEPHPEGGYYRETFRSEEIVQKAEGKRNALTTIYYLLKANQFSRWHKVTSAEVWNYCSGDALELNILSPDLKNLNQIKLGSINGGFSTLEIVPANYWQAARPLGEYSLVSCAVAPGFDFADFSFMDEDTIVKGNLETSFPSLAALL